MLKNSDAGLRSNHQEYTVQSTENAAGKDTDNGAEGCSHGLAVIQIDPEYRMRGPESKSEKAQHSSIWNKATRVFEVVKRIPQLSVSLAKTACYRNDPGVPDILLKGGLCGKIGQVLAIRLLANQDNSRGLMNDPVVALSNTLSQYQPAEISPEDVVAGLRQKNKENDVKHVATLGRGTICQVDHVVINRHEFAVKSLTPALRKSIQADVDAVSNLVIYPANKAGGISNFEVDSFYNTVNAFADETNLSLELQYTVKQKKNFDHISESGRHSILIDTDAGPHQIPVKFTVPEVYKDLSSREALVMELVKGSSLDRTDDIINSLKLWKPAWNNHEVLTETQIKQILNALKKPIIEAYQQGAREFCMVNADFQPGNFMIKLEDQGTITVYFIDHGNCIEKLDHPADVNTAMSHMPLMYSLIEFLHSNISARTYRSSDKKNDNVFEQSDNPGTAQEDSPSCPDCIQDLRFTPWNDTCLREHLEKLLTCETEMAEAFGFEHSEEDQLSRSVKKELAVSELCGKIYDGLKETCSVVPDSKAAVGSKEAFISALVSFTHGLAASYQGKELNIMSPISNLRMGKKSENFLSSYGFLSSLNYLFLLFRIKTQLDAFKSTAY